jgi:hypothetical protein
MMSKRRAQADDLCVLRIDVEVHKLAGVVFSDSNAASKYVRFYAPSQWRLLPFDDIYAMDWRHPSDQIREWRHAGAQMCRDIGT